MATKEHNRVARRPGWSAAQARGARGASAWRARRKLYRNQGFARDARVGADLCAQAWQLFQRSESLEAMRRGLLALGCPASETPRETRDAPGARPGADPRGCRRFSLAPTLYVSRLVRV